VLDSIFIIFHIYLAHLPALFLMLLIFLHKVNKPLSVQLQISSESHSLYIPEDFNLCAQLNNWTMKYYKLKKINPVEMFVCVCVCVCVL
jgi:hypothetical protein